LDAVDALIYAMLPGQMITIAGRTSQGKTSMVIGILYENLLHGIPVGLISLEMNSSEIARRMMAYGSGLQVKLLERARLSDEELTTFTVKTGEMGDWPMPIADKPRMFLHDARAALRHMKHRYGIKLAAVDYLQLLQADPQVEGQRFGTREREVSHISAEIKRMARELNIPIIAVAQLSRASEYRADKRPLLSDLRESGAIEQDSDTVIFLFRPWYYDHSADEHKAEVNVAKQRNGPIGTVTVYWQPESARFSNAVIRDVSLDEMVNEGALNGRKVYRGGE
jgi:replicative DNA helicase